MRAGLRRGARELVDDAIDRVRTGPLAVLLLFVLPSLPFLQALLRLGVDLDQRGAVPPGATLGVVAMTVPKLLGWAALAAWGGAAARGDPCSLGAAWAWAARRLPEALLAASLLLLSVALAPFTAGLSLLLTAPCGVGLAAATAPGRSGRSGGRAVIRQSLGALRGELARGLGISTIVGIAAAFVFANCVLVPFLVVPLGAGGLGVDLSGWLAAFRPDRAAAWALAAGLTALVIEPVALLACVEWQRDRESERDGTRYLAFADELEARERTSVAAESAA